MLGLVHIMKRLSAFCVYGTCAAYVRWCMQVNLINSNQIKISKEKSKASEHQKQQRNNCLLLIANSTERKASCNVATISYIQVMFIVNG